MMHVKAKLVLWIVVIRELSLLLGCCGTKHSATTPTQIFVEAVERTWLRSRTHLAGRK